MVVDYSKWSNLDSGDDDEPAGSAVSKPVTGERDEKLAAHSAALQHMAAEYQGALAYTYAARRPTKAGPKSRE